MKKGKLFENGTVICCCIILIFGASVSGSENKKNDSLTENDLKGIKKVAIVVEQKRDFELLYHRAKTAYGTASLLGGFEGDAIAHGIDKGKDKKAAEPMIEAVKDVCCSPIFIESLSPLKKSTRFETVNILSDANQKTNLSDYDATVTFTINRWGLRLVEREANNVAAFVEVESKMVTSKSKKPVWENREVIIGSRKETPQTFAADGKMLREELQATIKKAGLQMSNVLIYPAANPEMKSKSKDTKVKTGKVTALEINNSINYKVGALSSIKPLKIEVGTFTDNRQITDRIGDLRNGFGGKAGEINTARPAPEIVREAMVSVFTKNGHIVNSGEKDIVISGSVETYWFESQLKMSSWELMGTVDINMVVQDNKGNILFSKRFLGHKDKIVGLFWPKTIIEIMDAAMENLTDQIPFDTKLIEAINGNQK